MTNQPPWGAEPPHAVAGWSSQAPGGSWASSPLVKTPQKRTNTAGPVLVTLVVVLAVIGGGVYAAVAFARRAAGGPGPALTKYYADVAAQKYPQAYDLICTAGQAATTIDAATAVWEQERLASALVTSSAISTTQTTGASALLSGTNQRVDGTTAPFAVSLLKEGGAWKVCPFPG